ncbi:hypothetical protein OIO90_001528 [Microbotryomycetes sp. JL221]|nr:hypothetical protein OIO90_001528 [Microbotryomycetes sp. JL221]
MAKVLADNREPEARMSSRLPCPSTPLPSRFDSLPILTRTDIAAKIISGQLIVVHPPLVYRVPHAWLSQHPGGDLAILHYVGRDATNEIEAYHTGKTVKQRMGAWVIGKLEALGDDGWRDMVPPVQLSMWPLPVPRITVSAPPSDDEEEKRRKMSLGPQARVLTEELVDPPSPPEDQLPLTPAYQHHLRQSLRKLHQRIQDKGLDTPPPVLSGYGPSLILYFALGLAAIHLYRRAQSTLDYFAAAVALGLWWHQITFVAHDAGHTGLTGDWLGDRIRGLLIADVLGGLSIGWWADNHNVHHLVTNSPEHDPDIQHLPFFAISTRFFDSVRSSYQRRILEFDGFAKRMIKHQHKLYYIIMCFARFNLFALSYIFLLKSFPDRRSPLFKLRLAEFVGIAVFWTWFSAVLRGIDGVGNRVMYLLVSFAVTSPLHVQIVLSHFSQPVSIAPTSLPHTELLESHAHRQLRTTMDISCPTYLDFLHGGLNFQLPHHLFPRIPRFRFRQVAKEVEVWVKEEQELVRDGTFKGRKLKPNEGLVYKKMTFVEGNKDVLSVLKAVANQVHLLAKVAEADAKGQLHKH